MTNILAIQPRQQDLRTQTNEDWTDGFPLYRAGPAGVVVGKSNVGNGTLTVQSVDPMTLLGGHRVEVTATGSLTAITATDPYGTVTARGFVGAPLYAGGILLTVTAGSTAFAVGDTFAVQPTIDFVDDTGIRYVLQVRQTQDGATVVFQADSAPQDGSTPTIVAGNGTGRPALMVPFPLMDASRFPPGDYVYDLIAVADGRRRVAYFGNLSHVQGAGYIP